MPTYEYRCDACGYAFDQFQPITARPLKTCPSCKRRTMRRLIGTGGGIIFKGSGFYQTDYRSESYKKAAEADKQSSSTAPKDKETKGNGQEKKPAKAGAAKKARSVAPK
jgi:putative FmdB family regulatory protein